MFVLIESLNVLVRINKKLKENNAKQLDIQRSMDAILSYPFTWLDINFPIIRRAAQYEYSIAGADYIHVASMEINNIKNIISADEELDEVDIVKRIDPLKY